MKLPLHFRPSASLRCFSLLLISCLLVHSAARASGERISPFNSNGEYDPGAQNPCAGLDIRLVNFTPPAGASLSSISWYGNGNFIASSSGIDQTVQIISNDGHGAYNVYAVAHYSNGSTGTSNTYSLTINLMALTTPSQSSDAVYNCTSPTSFRTNFGTGGLGEYVPPPSYINSFTWSLPGSWTLSSTSGGSAGGNSYSVANVTPDAFSAGNVSATVTLFCGYTTTSPVLAISRTTPAPGNIGQMGVVCAGNSTSGTLTPICGPTSYTWTVPSNSGVTFSNGLPSISSSSSTVGISTSGSAPSADVPVSITANYPNGFTSSGSASGILHVGVPTDPDPILGMPQGTSICEGSNFDVYIGFQPTETLIWNVSFLESSANGLTGGGQTGYAYIQLPSGYTYQNDGDVVDEWLITLQSQNACGLSNWETSLSGYIVGCGGGGGGVGSSNGRNTMPGAANGLTVSNTLRVFPNPAIDVVNVSLPDSVNPSTATISLFDVYGRQLKKIVNVSSLSSIYLSGLAKGVYMVEIFDGMKLLDIKKIVKK